MKKFLLVFALSLVLASLGAFCPCVYAYPDELTEDIASEIADTSYGGFISDGEKNGDVTINIAQKTVDIISSCFSDGVKAFAGAFVTLAGAVVASSLLCSLKFENQSLSAACEFVSVLVLSAALYSITVKATAVAQTALRAFDVFVASYIPVMASLWTAGGNPASCAASTGGLSVFLSVIELVADSVLLPMTNWCFAISLAGAMPSGINFTSLWALIRNTVTTVLAFLFFALNFMLSFQPLAASGADSFALRSARFASGSFIPVIGSMLAETAKTVCASVAQIKSVSGSAAVVAALACTVPPALYILFVKLAVLVCAMLARLLGNQSQSSFLYEINSLLGIVLGVVIGCACVFIVAAGVFMTTTSGLSA